VTATNGNTPAATLAPYSEESEVAVIGAVLVDPAAWLELTFLTPDSFFILRHRHIWQAFSRLAGRQDQIDLITVGNELRAMGKLQDVGGPAYLLNLVNNTPTSLHAEVYGRMVFRAAARRRLLEAGDNLRRLALDEHMALEDVLDGAQQTVISVIDSTADSRFEHQMPDVVDRLLGRIEQAMENPAQGWALPTGFRDLDTLLAGGLWRGDLITVAGRPGMGKTAFMLGIAMNMARVGVRVGITSLEMNADSLVLRMAAMETGINLQKLRMGNLNSKEWQTILKAAPALRELPIVTNDAPVQTVDQIHAQGRRWQMMYGLDCMILDYLGLLHSADQPRGKRDDNRVLEISRMTRGCKELARDLNIPVIMAAQVNRGPDARTDKRPMLSDLRESGSIENDSDVVAFIFREVVYDDATENPNKAEIIIAKHRNGPTDTVVLHYERQLTKFLDSRPQLVDLKALTS
jgi:replicative DNA helicase